MPDTKLSEEIDQRLAILLAESRHREREGQQLNLCLSSLTGHVMEESEQALKDIVEEFAGQTFPSAERLVLRDEAGELYGMAGAEVEFDLYAHNGAAYLVEVKFHLKLTDVFSFYQRVKFAERKTGRSFIPLVIALRGSPETLMRQQHNEIHAGWTEQVYGASSECC